MLDGDVVYYANKENLKRDVVGNGEHTLQLNVSVRRERGRRLASIWMYFGTSELVEDAEHENVADGTLQKFKKN